MIDQKFNRCYFKAIDNWLFDINMQQYVNQFYSHDLDDFLTLPFLKIESLEAMGISLEDRNIIFNSITQIMEYSKPECTLSMFFLIR
jgi:hypothetical protein